MDKISRFVDVPTEDLFKELSTRFHAIVLVSLEEPDKDSEEANVSYSGGRTLTVGLLTKALHSLTHDTDLDDG